MNAGHTPGPWTQEEQGTGYRTSIMADGGRWHVADVCISGEPGAADDSEADANARLIAAAPDLLAALRGMLDAYDNSGEPSGMTDAYDIACGAIERATGAQ